MLTIFKAIKNSFKKTMTEKEYLKQNPLCVQCLKCGTYRKASVVYKLTNGDIESRCTECARGKILN
jgi:hypothetical protein